MDRQDEEEEQIVGEPDSFVGRCCSLAGSREGLLGYEEAAEEGGHYSMGGHNSEPEGGISLYFRNDYFEVFRPGVVGRGAALDCLWRSKAPLGDRGLPNRNYGAETDREKKKKL